MTLPSPRVFLFSTHTGPGGTRKLWESLEEGLRARGHPVALQALYRNDQEDEGSDGPTRWGHIVRKLLPGPLGPVQSAVALAFWLRRTRPEIIIAAMPMANILLARLIPWFSPRTRVIETHHIPVATYHPLMRWLTRRNGGAKPVTAVVSVSCSVAASLDPCPPAAKRKHRIIYNAVPPTVTAHLLALAEQRAPRAARGRTLCAIGRLTEQKNFATLIHAAALMPDVRVEIIGGGPDREALTALIAEKNVGDRVLLLGQRPRHETLERLAGADVFVQISRFEGHSLALIEAATIGLPLIVSDVPVQIEGVTGRDGTPCGLIVDVDDQAEIAEKACMLLDDPAGYRLWSERAVSLSRDYDFDAMCDSYAQLIAQAASVPGGAVREIIEREPVQS